MDKSQFPYWLQVLQAFAGPVATTIASVTAAGVAIAFGRIQASIARGQAETARMQVEIAKSQRDIAYDKLKHDLFERRYGIYKAAKTILERIAATPFSSGAEDPELRALRLQVDEAHFFFPPKEAAIFERMGVLMADHEGARMMGARSTSDEARSRYGDRAANAINEMLEIYETLPKKLAKELGFAQLTSINE